MRGMRGRLEERQGDLNPGRDAAVELELCGRVFTLGMNCLPATSRAGGARDAAREPTAGPGGPDHTSEWSRSVTSMWIRTMLGRIHRSRRGRVAYLRFPAQARLQRRGPESVPRRRRARA